MPITHEGWTSAERVGWLLRLPAQVAAAELARNPQGPWFVNADGKAPRHAVEALRKQGLQVDRAMQLVEWVPAPDAASPAAAAAEPVDASISIREAAWLAFLSALLAQALAALLPRGPHGDESWLRRLLRRGHEPRTQHDMHQRLV